MGGPPYSIDRDRKSKSHQAPKCKKRTGVESWSETKKERQSQPVWSRRSLRRVVRPVVM